MYLLSINFYKGANTIQWGYDSLFNKRCLENWRVTDNKLGHYFMPLTKIDSQWTKVFNAKPHL